MSSEADYHQAAWLGRLSTAATPLDGCRACALYDTAKTHLQSRLQLVWTTLLRQPGDFQCQEDRNQE